MNSPARPVSPIASIQSMYVLTSEGSCCKNASVRHCVWFRHVRRSCTCGRLGIKMSFCSKKKIERTYQGPRRSSPRARRSANSPPTWLISIEFCPERISMMSTAGWPSLLSVWIPPECNASMLCCSVVVIESNLSLYSWWSLVVRVWISVGVRVSLMLVKQVPLVILLKVWCTWWDEEEPETAPLPDEMWAFKLVVLCDDSWDRRLWEVVFLCECLLPNLLPSVIWVNKGPHDICTWMLFWVKTWIALSSTPTAA